MPDSFQAVRHCFLLFILFRQILGVQGTGGVEHSQHHHAHIGKDGGPHAGHADRAQHKAGELDGQCKHDVLVHDAQGAAGNAHGQCDLGRVVVHQDNVSGLDGSIGAQSTHLVRRDTREKVFVSLDELETAIPAQLEALRKDLYERALANREKRTWAATTMDEVKELAKANTGYIKTMWCGDLACEMKMKEEVGLSSRCMPFEQEHLSDVCPCCGKPAKTMVYWGIAY